MHQHGFDELELAAQRAVIHDNIVRAVLLMLDAMQVLNIALEHQSNQVIRHAAVWRHVECS